MMYTTLNKIRAHEPCADGWSKLLRNLGKTAADDEPLSLETILDSNGLDDALWALRAVGGHEREIRLFAVWCARHVQHLMNDPRSLDAIDVAERFAHGQATADELAAASSAASSAARAAAWDAASSAASSAARAAAWAAAWDAAWDAASSAASSAARAAASSAASSAARAAAWDAALAAAWDAQIRELRAVLAACEVPHEP